MGKLVLIGGGENGWQGSRYETEDIDREIIALTEKQNPNFLLIALASDDPEIYYQIMENVYGNMLHCSVEQIKPSDLKNPRVLYEKIQWADIIYVGGGNTLKLMNLLRRYQVDELLFEAYMQNKVLCGISAGAICWCDYGNSDSRFYTGRTKKLIKVKGLGLVPALLCPHYDVESHRRDSLKEMMKRTFKIPAIALGNCAALEIVNDEFRIITSSSHANAFKCFWKGTQYIECQLEKGVFHKVEELYSKQLPTAKDKSK